MEVSRIRIVRSNIAVWLIYAGRGRRFFDIFKETNSVFLSLPGFDANERVFESEELMRRHLHMSDEIGRWAIGASDRPPSRKPDAYSPYPYKPGSSERKTFAAELGNIERLFVAAKAGDLVLSPPFGHFDPFLVGEISHAWRKADDLEVPLLQGEVVPARKVQWLNVALAHRDFPARVSRRLRNQHAIIKVDSDFYEDILNLVYPSYVWGERSKLDVFGYDYTGRDPLQTYHSANLMKYVIASVFAFKTGDLEKFQQLEVGDAIKLYYNEQLVEKFGQNFNSPGKFSIIAAISGLAFLASAGIIVAKSDPTMNFDQVKVEAVTTIKGALKGPDRPASERELDEYVNSMKATHWKKVQQSLGKPSNESMPLSLSNTAEVENHRATLNAK